MKINSTNFILVLIISFFIYGCGNKKSKKKEDNTQQYNITIFLDLSDRIDPTKYPMVPSMMDRDLSTISDIISFVKKDHQKKGNYKMKDCIKVFMNPTPDIKDISNLINKLNNDYGVLTPKDKKKLYPQIDSIYKNNLSLIYKNIIDNKYYPGSDIWGFFKNNAKNVCINTNKNFRNILIIFTDGYMYHPSSKIREGNRYSYIIPELIKSYGLIKSNWKNIIQKKNFGYLNPRQNKDLNNLEVVVVNMNNTSKSPYEQDLLEYLWTDLFNNMGVNKYRLIMTSDIQDYVSKPLLDFIEN